MTGLIERQAGSSITTDCTRSISCNRCNNQLDRSVQSHVHLICVRPLKDFVSLQRRFYQFVHARQAMAPIAKVSFKRWIKPEIYPLILVMGTALSAGGFTMVRNLTLNPDVRVSKEEREAGMFDNYQEGETYKNHSLRKYLANQEPMIIPTANNHFSAPK